MDVLLGGILLVIKNFLSVVLSLDSAGDQGQQVYKL